MSDERKIDTPAAADRPTYKILSEGSEIRQEYQVKALTVRRSVNRITSATILLLDGDPAKEDFAISSGEEFTPGKIIEIQAGYHSNEEIIFKGVVVKHGIRAYENKPSVLRIECKDEAVKLSIRRNNKYFYESTDSEILEEIINGIGLQPEVESTDISHQELVQFNTTDWDFLVSRSEANGKLVFTEDGVVKIAQPDLGQSPTLRLKYGGNLLDFEAEMDARHQYEAVNAYAWDAANQERLELESEDLSDPLPGNLSPSDLAAVIGLDHFDLHHAGQIKDAELQAWANAQLLKSRLSKVRGRARIQGYGAIRPGMVISIDGLGDRFNGTAYVSGVMHEINTKNWETNIELGLSPHWFSKENEHINDCPAGGMLAAVNGLQIGLVSAIEEDPEGEDRVQVRIPMIDPAEEGVWARVASLDAGENRGAFFRPEIGDEVVLGFLNEDPRNPIILGMLNSSAKPAPYPGADDNHIKGFVTRSEMKLTFDDENVVTSIETPNGNKIVLSDADGGITLEDENGNKVVMSSDGINLESAKDVIITASGDVKIEGTNVELKASANFKAEGSAGAEMSTSASAVVKGSTVMIN